MATPKLLSKLLRRRSQTLTSISSSAYSYSSTCSYSIFFMQSSNRETPQNGRGLQFSAVHPLALRYGFALIRSFSTRHSEYGRDLSLESETRPQGDQLSDLGISPATATCEVDGSEIAEALVSASDVDGDGVTILPVRAVISFLDFFHDSTGWPWWVIIASSVLALRITLLPLLILHLKKMQKIAEYIPKLPFPLPQPLSGISFRDQFSHFRAERLAIGCPSYLWIFAYAPVQVSCFVLGMTAVRRMSLNHHPGFDCGGTQWFQDLTDYPNGISGFIFPLLIASLHFSIVQISFRTSSTGKATSLFGLLFQYYKVYLNVLTLPILLAGFCVPQGSLVYWVMNSSLSLVQSLLLCHPGVLENMGLPNKAKLLPPENHQEMVTPGETQDDLLKKQQKFPTQHLSPRELLVLSVKHLAEGHKDRAMPLLRLALDKDPEYVRALVVMGQTLLQDGELEEAVEYLERAISKLFLVGHLTEVEEVDLLILASQWVGVAYIRQSKIAEGIKHLERVANLKEPEDDKSKAHYYDAFLVLASALYNVGRKPEAVKFLRMAAAYDSSYNVYLEQCEKDEVDHVSDLVSSRRSDY